MSRLGRIFQLCTYVINCVKVFITERIEDLNFKINVLLPCTCEGIARSLFGARITQYRNSQTQTRSSMILELKNGAIVLSNGTRIDTRSFRSLPRLLIEDQSSEVRRKIISADMTFPFKRVFMISCWNHEIRPDVVATFLGKYDRHVSLRDKWLPSEQPQKQRRLTTAVFSEELRARRARKDLTKLSSSIVITKFENLIRFLLNNEIKHPFCGRSTTQVSIYCKRGISAQNVLAVEKELHALGNIEYIRFNELKRKSDLIGVAHYSFTTQAIAAKAMLDGMVLKKVGLIRVEMESGDKEKTVLDNIIKTLPKLSRVET